jgi:hypothetical protein
MRHPSTVAAIVLTCSGMFAGAAPVAAAAPTNLLLNGGAEQGKGDQPSIWSAASVAAAELKMTRDTAAAHDGKASLSIANTHKYDQPTANNWMQPLQSLPTGKTVVVSGWIKAADADAANVCLQCWDASGKEMVGFASTPVVRGDQDWTLLKSEPLVVPERTKSVIVRAALSGTGTAWFDDIAVTEVADVAAAPTAAAADAPSPRVADASSAPNAAGALANELRQQLGGEVAEIIPVTGDQMILSYIPDWAHGAVDNIGVELNDSGAVRTLFTWPKPKAKAEGHRFLLACYAREGHAPSERPAKSLKLGAYEVLDKWDEKTSWEKQPALAAAPAAEADVRGNPGWVIFDVTPLVRKQLAADGGFNGVSLRFVSEDVGATAWVGYRFVSREGEGEWSPRRPLLLVVKE